MDDIFVRRSDDVYCKFEGMSIEVVSALLANLGKTGTIITKEEYDAARAQEPRIF